jgi:hypothetical protein
LFGEGLEAEFFCVVLEGQGIDGEDERGEKHTAGENECRHTREPSPSVIPAKAGIHFDSAESENGSRLSPG